MHRSKFVHSSLEADFFLKFPTDYSARRKDMCSATLKRFCFQKIAFRSLVCSPHFVFLEDAGVLYTWLCVKPSSSNLSPGQLLQGRGRHSCDCYQVQAGWGSREPLLNPWHLHVDVALFYFFSSCLRWNFIARTLAEWRHLTRLRLDGIDWLIFPAKWFEKNQEYNCGIYCWFPRFDQVTMMPASNTWSVVVQDSICREGKSWLELIKLALLDFLMGFYHDQSDNQTLAFKSLSVQQLNDVAPFALGALLEVAMALSVRWVGLADSSVSFGSSFNL